MARWKKVKRALCLLLGILLCSVLCGCSYYEELTEENFSEYFTISVNVENCEVAAYDESIDLVVMALPLNGYTGTGKIKVEITPLTNKHLEDIRIQYKVGTRKIFNYGTVYGWTFTTGNYNRSSRNSLTECYWAVNQTTNSVSLSQGNTFQRTYDLELDYNEWNVTASGWHGAPPDLDNDDCFIEIVSVSGKVLQDE